MVVDRYRSGIISSLCRLFGFARFALWVGEQSVRHRRHVALGVTFSVATLLSPGTAQTADAAPRIAWESDFDAALQRAQKESKPLLVAFLKDNEPANDETINQHYADPEIVKLSGKFV